MEAARCRGAVAETTTWVGAQSGAAEKSWRGAGAGRYGRLGEGRAEQAWVEAIESGLGK